MQISSFKMLVVVAVSVGALSWASAALAVSNTVNWFKVSSGATIQAKIDSCIAGGGGVVYFPPGTYTLPTSTTLRLYPNSIVGGAFAGVTLLGDGPDVSVVTCANADTVLHIMRDNVVVQGLTFQTTPGPIDTSIGIVLGDKAPVQHVLKFIKFRDVTVRSTGWQALKAADIPSITIGTSFDGCRFLDNRGSTELVLIGAGNTTLHFRSCTFEAFRQSAVTLRGCDGITFTDCIFEGETNNASPFFYADKAVNCSIRSGWFEDDQTLDVGLSSAQWFVQLDRACHGFGIDHCTFRREGLDVPSQNPKAILVSGTTSLSPPTRNESVGVLILNPEILSAATLSATANYISISSDSSEVLLIGGYVRQSTSLVTSTVRISDKDRLMTFGGTRCLKLMRLPDGQVTAMPLEKSRIVFNKTTNRADIVNDTGWAGVATGIR